MAPGPSDAQASSGLIVDVVRLLRWPGNQSEVHVHLQPDDVSISSAAVGTLDGMLIAESMADSLTVTGSLDLVWSGACRRCMEPTGGTVALDLREVFEKSPIEGETYELDADRLDLEPMIREAAILGLPLAPLCAEDCEGPAPHSYPAAVEVDVEAEPKGDPRWAALDEIVFDE